MAILDSVGLPIISGVDALVVLVSVLDRGQGYTAAFAATVGSIIGSLVLFFIARKGGEEYLHRYTSHGRGARLRAWFVEFGLLTIFVPALVVIPMPMKLFVLAAGALEVSPLKFIIVLAAARIPRYFLLAWLGTRLGTDTLPYLRSHVWWLLLFAVVLFAGLYFAITVVHRRKRHLFTDLD